MNTEQQKQSPILPFGRYAGQRLSEIPTSYLTWLIRETKLAHGLRVTLAGEPERRGVSAPAPNRAPRPTPACTLCPPGTGFTAH
jgi:hypothetical protein